MCASVGSGIVNPDSHPPILGSHAVVGAVRPRPMPAHAASCAGGGVAFPRPRPPPPPPPRPPRPNPPPPCIMVLFSGRQPLPVVSELVDGPRIVPASWRLL